MPNRNLIPATQRGSSMLEALIALLILSIGIVALMKLQSESMRQNTDSRFVVMAGSKAQSIMDAITYERKLSNNKAVAYSDSDWALAKGSDTGTVSNTIIRPWLTSVQKSLPGGDASIACTDGVCTITIFWSPGKSTQIDKSVINEQSAKYVVQNPSAAI